MKKFACFVLALFLAAGLAIRLQAQSVAYYDFEVQTDQTYTALTDATDLTTNYDILGEGLENLFFSSSDSVDYDEAETIGGAISIGFDFEFDGKTYSTFVAGGAGFILLGNEKEIVFPNGIGTRFWYPIIGIGTDGSAYGTENTSIQYKLEGAAPEQILTIQYTGMSYMEEGQSGQLDYQIKLHEADNHIEMIFGSTVSFGSSGDWFHVGLRGDGDPLYISPVDDSWAETEFNTAGNATIGNTTFPEGLKYVFNLPPDCEAPTVNVSDLALTATSTMVTGLCGRKCSRWLYRGVLHV